MLARRISLLVVTIVTVFSIGCGGGGKSPIPPPSGAGQPSATLTANPNRVRGGESVSLTISANQPIVSVQWDQNPPTPRGEFQGDRMQAIWTAPVVTATTSFTLIARVGFSSGDIVTASAQVTVEPQGDSGGGSSPPPVPPTISLSYPPQDGRINVVADGVKLTLIGNTTSGSYSVSRIQVIDSDGSVLQEWPIGPGLFRVDLERFGSLGQKIVKLRVVDTNGNFSETSLQLINDPSLLDQLAREFLRRYCVLADGGLARFGNLTTGPFSKAVGVYLADAVKPYSNLCEQAFQFWESYTGIRFQFIDSYPQRPDDSSTPAVIIGAAFEKDPGYAAVTSRGYQRDSHEITDGSITLYRGWWQKPDSERIRTIAHELGHVLVTMAHPNDGGVFDEWGKPIEMEVMHPYHQFALRILYTKNPGEPL
ncbi:MAG: hypothetical protein SLRJCFUN_000088 [Candidatus Fervidibacter sp.]